MPSTVDIITRYKEQKAQRHNWDNNWQKIAELLVPHLANIRTKRADGDKLTQELFDATGIDALNKLVNALVSTVSGMWFSLRMRNEDLNFEAAVQLWLDQSSRRMFNALNVSNFRSAIHETFFSLAAFGTGCLFLEENKDSRIRGFRGLRFQSVPIGTYVIQENGMGIVDTVVREIDMTLVEIVKRWGPESLHPDRLRQFESKPYQQIPVLHSVQPASLWERQPWESKYIDLEKQYDLTKPKLFKDFPFFVARWDKTSGEIWGRGPGHTAIPEVATLNRARQLKLEQWALAVYPVLNVLETGVVNVPKIVPGGLNVVRQLDAIRPLEIGQRFDHTAIPENESKLQIRQIFLTEQLLQFQAMGKTPPTATEILQRLEFLHQLLGPAVARIQKELLMPLLDRTFNLMLRAKALPDPPLLLSGEQLDIHFEGPLARAQRSDELRSLQDTLALGGGISQMNPDVLDNIDADVVMRDLFRITGTRLRYLRPPEDVEAIRQQRLQAMQQQQQMAMAQQAMEVEKGAADVQAKGGGASGQALQGGFSL